MFVVWCKSGKRTHAVWHVVAVAALQLPLCLSLHDAARRLFDMSLLFGCRVYVSFWHLWLPSLFLCPRVIYSQYQCESPSSQP